ncbi:MAG: hypothetical protein PHN80_05010 [Hespellia sp.]|nr:hypothetical protein [Hespellia sp.]
MKKEEFLHDKTYAHLFKAVSKREYADVKKYARELKTITDEFGYEKMSALCEDIQNAVRIKCYKAIPKMFEELEEEYECELRKMK